jgi:Putative transposase/Transposase zinc-binding domain
MMNSTARRQRKQVAATNATASKVTASKATVASTLRNHPLPADYSDGLPTRFDNRSGKAIQMLTRCRHGELGAKQHHCGDCGSSRVTLNACGDRHCPQCAKQTRFQWQAKVKAWALDVDYVHLVTTLPHELNDLVAANDGILLRSLFNATRKSITAMISQHYACTPGIVQVVHTWGQQLGRHYHIHNVMTAGGLSHDRTEWLPIDQDELETRTVELAARFKKCFLKHLRFLLGQGRLQLPRSLPDQVSVEKLLATLEKKTWVADIGATPAKYRNSGDRQRTFGYLAKYIAGTAIGDGRILSDENGWVSFEFYDYVTDTYSIKKILGVEFHILFRQHILPSRLPRCRMSGLFASGSRRDGRLELCRQRINEANQQASNDAQSLRPDSDLPLADTTEDELVDTRSIVACKECGVEMSQSYSIKGREICSTLRLVPLVLAALAATTSLMIAEAIKLVVEARLQVGGSQRYKISLCVFLSSEYHYDEQLHLTLSTLVAQALPEPIATPPTPRGPP